MTIQYTWHKLLLQNKTLRGCNTRLRLTHVYDIDKTRLHSLSIICSILVQE